MIAVLIIGSEIVSGQVEDKNLKYILQNFKLSGHQISEIRIIPDNKDLIIESIRDLSQKYSYLISSGGIGPTHDDLTIPCFAEAFHEKLVENALLKASLKEFYKDKLTDEALRMSYLPETAELLGDFAYNWPLIKHKNCFILPGLPQIFKEKFDKLMRYLPPSKKLYEANIFVLWDESYFAAELESCEKGIEALIIGSYPIFGKKEFNTQITLKHCNLETLNSAFLRLTNYFDSHKVLIRAEL
jgi:molybdenum cofactor synthesis domain-containing protein